MTWNLRKTLQLFGIILFALGIASLQSYITASTKVEAAQSHQSNLEWRDQINLPVNTGGVVRVFCNKANGDTVYVVGSYNGGVAVSNKSDCRSR